MGKLKKGVDKTPPIVYNKREEKERGARNEKSTEIKKNKKTIDNWIKKCYNNNVNKNNIKRKKVFHYGKENHKERNVCNDYGRS